MGSALIPGWPNAGDLRVLLLVTGLPGVGVAWVGWLARAGVWPWRPVRAGHLSLVGDVLSLAGTSYPWLGTSYVCFVMVLGALTRDMTSQPGICGPGAAAGERGSRDGCGRSGAGGWRDGTTAVPRSAQPGRQVRAGPGQADRHQQQRLKSPAPVDDMTPPGA